MGRGSSKIDRGSTSGGSSASINRSLKARQEIIQLAKNNRFAMRNGAADGTGVYSFFNAAPIDDSEAMKMRFAHEFERGGYTLFHGTVDDKFVFIAGKSDTPIIKKMKAKQDAQHKKDVAEAKNAERPEIRTTSTYDRWKKRNDANFAAWFGTDRIEKVKEATKRKKKK